MCGHGQAASPLDGQTFLIEISSSQSAIGRAADLLPSRDPRPGGWGEPGKAGPSADIVFNIITHTDIRPRMETEHGRAWLCEQTITTGIRPAPYVISVGATQQFCVA